MKIVVKTDLAIITECLQFIDNTNTCVGSSISKANYLQLKIPVNNMQQYSVFVNIKRYIAVH